MQVDRHQRRDNEMPNREDRQIGREIVARISRVVGTADGAGRAHRQKAVEQFALPAVHATAPCAAVDSGPEGVLRHGRSPANEILTAIIYPLNDPINSLFASSADFLPKATTPSGQATKGRCFNRLDPALES